MKLYRDLQPGETLQAGDEILADPPQWVPVNSSLFGLSPALRGLPEYRRPVDAVPREEYERLQKELTDTVDQLRAEIQSLNIRGWATSHDWGASDLTNEQKAPVTKPPSAESI